MQKVRFISYYGKFNTDIFMESSKDYGSNLICSGNELARKLQDEYNCKIVNDDSFDTIVISDLDGELYEYAKNLDKRIKKILILLESPIYTPFAHNLEVLCDPMWYKVLSYNREFDCPNLVHYDIPITGIQKEYNVESINSDLCCHIASFKNDIRGYTKERDNLVLELMDKNLINVFGFGWKNHINYRGLTDNKIRDISHYKYYLACENAKYSGYLTEKIGDSILAERPCIYFGDSENAQRRFPDTFVPIEDLSFDCFMEARKKLLDNYDYYYKNVLREKKNSIRWCDSYWNSMINAILT